MNVPPIAVLYSSNCSSFLRLASALAAAAFSTAAFSAAAFSTAAFSAADAFLAPALPGGRDAEGDSSGSGAGDVGGGAGSAFFSTTPFPFDKNMAPASVAQLDLAFAYSYWSGCSFGRARRDTGVAAHAAQASRVVVGGKGSDAGSLGSICSMASWPTCVKETT